MFDYISSFYSHVKDVFLRFIMLNKNDRCHSFLVKSSWICALPDRPDVPTNKGENERGWHGQIFCPLCQMGYHCPHRSLSRCRIHPLAQVDQSATATTLSSTNVIPVTP